MLESLTEDLGGDTYRIAYTMRLKTAVYVLHAFKKKSKSGSKTPKSDIDLIQARQRAAGLKDKEREEEQKQGVAKTRNRVHGK